MFRVSWRYGIGLDFSNHTKRPFSSHPFVTEARRGRGAVSGSVEDSKGCEVSGSNGFQMAQRHSGWSPEASKYVSSGPNTNRTPTGTLRSTSDSKVKYHAS